MLRPNASRLLLRWGLGQDLASVSDEVSTTVIKLLSTGEVKARRDAANFTSSPDWGAYRGHVQGILYQHVQALDIDVRFGTHVISVTDDPQQATVVLKDGTRLIADLVIAADGVRSKIRSNILADSGVSIEAVISDMSIHQCKVPLREARQNAAVAQLCTTDDLQVWVGKGAYVVARKHGGDGGFFQGSFALQEDGTATGQGLWDEVSILTLLALESSC